MIRHGNGNGPSTLPMGDGRKEKKDRTRANTFGAHDSRNQGMMASPGQFVRNPRLFLFVACLWPLAILALFASSAPGTDRSQSSSQLESQARGAVISLEAAVAKAAADTKLFEMRKLLDRVDVVGYGPTHPRVAFVVVGDTQESLIESVGSIFANTDLHRLFVVCAVLDADSGAEDHQRSKSELVKKLRTIEKNSAPHWHGLKRDAPPNGDEEDEPHSPKVHVFLNSDKKGLAASRADAAEFVQILVRTHEDAGFKSPDEDIILMLMQGGTLFKNNYWLSKVTPALIVKPPLLGLHNHDVAMKLANAISFHTEGPSKRTSFGVKMAPIVTDASASDISMSSGENFPTPALNGAAIAMRLGTFLNLPETDHSTAMDPWSANLDLSLNLWLCADGIDILENVVIIPPEGEIYSKTRMGIEQVARVASVWMDDEFRERFFQAYALSTLGDSGNDDEKAAVTRVDWETGVTKSQRFKSSSSQQLYKRCRTFEWYIQEVNSDLSDVLDMKMIADHRFDSVPEALEEVHEATEDKQHEESAAENEQNAAVIEEKDEAHIDPPESNKNQADEAIAENEQKVVVIEKKENKAEEEAGESEDKNKAVATEEKVEAHIAPPESNKNQDEKQSDGAVEETEEKAEEHNGIEKKKPSKPLRPFNLEIVQKPKMVDTAFVDVSGGYEEHPHKGALDANGEPGYIHDETALQRNPPPLGDGVTCEPQDDHWVMMHDRIIVETDYDKSRNEGGQKRDKIFCLVYTTESAHDRIPNIRKTWGPKCDGFMVGSTKTDASIGAVNIPHEGPEEYDNIWQKVRSMWSYIYDNYYEKYDWFHIGGDDLFLIVENLRYYLESEEIRTAGNGGIYLPEGNESRQTPLLLGRRFAYQGDMNNIFVSGGSGCTMNKAALKLLVTEGFPNYWPHRKTFSEDTMTADVLKKIDNILPYDTKDDAGGERYMPFMPGHHLSYKMPKDHKTDWYANYSIDIKEGLEHCAPRSVAFHYVKGEQMRRLFALAYGLCPQQPVTK